MLSSYEMEWKDALPSLAPLHFAWRETGALVGLSVRYCIASFDTP
jgi:hypothetical protein